jgi:hypothetical protein
MIDYYDQYIRGVGINQITNLSNLIPHTQQNDIKPN